MTWFTNDNQEIKNELKKAGTNAISHVSDYKKDHVKHNLEYLLDSMGSIKFTALQDTFDKS